MTIPIYPTFIPTSARWVPTAWRDSYKLITDNVTGAPVGVVSMSANGPQGIWALTPLSAAQIASPSAEMLADIGATYQLDEAPYTRYRSDGGTLVELGSGGVISGAARVVTSGSTVSMATTDFAVMINKTIGSATTVNLPTPSLGKQVLIKDMKGDAATNNITLDAGSGKLINGLQTLVMNANYGATELIGMSATQWGTVI